MTSKSADSSDVITDAWRRCAPPGEICAALETAAPIAASATYYGACRQLRALVRPETARTFCLLSEKLLEVNCTNLQEWFPKLLQFADAGLCAVYVGLALVHSRTGSWWLPHAWGVVERGISEPRVGNYPDIHAGDMLVMANRYGSVIFYGCKTTADDVRRLWEEGISCIC